MSKQLIIDAKTLRYGAVMRVKDSGEFVAIVASTMGQLMESWCDYTGRELDLSKVAEVSITKRKDLK